MLEVLCFKAWRRISGKKKGFEKLNIFDLREIPSIQKRY